MRLKSFNAKTMTEAMQMVRDMLGDDAVIVATREQRSGGVHVTAAVEPDFEVSQNGRAAPAEDWLQYDEEDEELAVAEELTEVMLRHNAPEDVMDNVLSCATVVGLENPEIALVASIEHLFNFRPLPTTPYQKAIMMVGPPGSGKTLAAAKLAARSTMDGLKVGVITTDTVRAGGAEQLSAFTKLLKIDLKQASSPKDLVHMIDEFSECEQVIIDTPGTNPFDMEHVKRLAKLIGTADIEPYLTLPAGGDADESGEIGKVFATIGVQSLIPTRVEITRRIGGILAAAHQADLSFADASNTPKVANGLLSLSPKVLAKLLMPGASVIQNNKPKAA